MKKMMLFLPCMLVFFIACGVKVETPVGTLSSPKISVPTTTLIQKKLSASDIFEQDEYLVKWGNYYIGKLLTPPSELKREAEFLMYYGQGGKRWESDFFQVRPATAADLTAGTEVIFFGGNESEGVYHLPSDRNNARQKKWYQRLVTDISLLASRGVVYVGNDKVDKNNIFVPITDIEQLCKPEK